MDQTIERVAEQLGFQAARIWPQVVMVTWITSLFWVIVDPLLIVGSVLGIVWIVRRLSAEIRAKRTAYLAEVEARGSASKFDYDSDGWMIGSVFAITALVFVMALAIVFFPDQLVGVLYPEATTVLRIAKGLK